MIIRRTLVSLVLLPVAMSAQTAADSVSIARIDSLLSSSVDEVVVTGYGSARKLGSVAGSVATVSGRQLQNRPVANLGDALQGQVAGLQVFTSSGEPSAGVSLRLRGVSSINASTTPLIILDGSQINLSAFIALNPADIESVTVLKDASATAIYGSRAANGVVILTSRRARYGEQPTVTASLQYGFSAMTGDHANMMNAQQWFDLQEMLDPAKKTNAAFQAKRDYYRRYGISTDWADLLFGDAKPTVKTDVTLRGGSESVSYLLSYGNYQAQGIMDDSDMRRHTLRANLESIVRPWLKVGANTALSYVKYNTAGFSETMNRTSVYNKEFASRIFLPTQAYYEILGLNPQDYANSTFGGYGDELLQFPEMHNRYNPYYISRLQPETMTNVRLNENAWVNVSPVRGLNVKSALGLEAYDSRNSGRTYPLEPFEEAGKAFENFSRYYQWTWTNTAEYKFTVARHHRLTTLVGQEYIYDKTSGFGVMTNGQTDVRLMLMSAAASADIPEQQISETVYNSLFATLNYDYRGRYFVDLSLRRDGSSLFGSGHQWATFGSVGAMWDMTAERFMAPARRWLQELKLKASYGSTGNSGIGAYQALGLVGSGEHYNGESGTAVANAANPELTWETVTTLNLGLTARLFNRVSLSMEYYNKVTSDMLMSIPYSFTTGFASGMGNVASMRNRGVDFDLSVSVLDCRDWHWDVRLNANYNSNLVTKLFHGQDEYVMSQTGIKLQVGHPFGEFYYVRWSHVDPRDGYNVWLDKHGNPTKVYSDDDKVMTGKNQYAPWSAGLSTTVTWRDLQLDLQFTGMFGRYMVNNERFFTENAAFATAANQTTDMLSMWQQPGDVTSIPCADSNVEIDTHLLENASFVRLKQLQLSYTLPQSVVSRLHVLHGARFFFVGRNLLTFTAFRGYDPEVNSNIAVGQYPNTRQFSIGTELTF
ncbi:MAG: SusC/RagA family TonB-linked outer membrane protein [Prevotella sp.]|nr:SusC/RagA family TonB-linked outer membrane protein [Prevotella sp.]